MLYTVPKQIAGTALPLWPAMILQAGHRGTSIPRFDAPARYSVFSHPRTSCHYGVKLLEPRIFCVALAVTVVDLLGNHGDLKQPEYVVIDDLACEQ